MIQRAYYEASIADFLQEDSASIIGTLSQNHSQNLVRLQTNAWMQQVEILKSQLEPYSSANNSIFFEFGIPRMGKRADAVIVANGFVFVIEFKVGSSDFFRHDKEQVLDYALDLKHFHEGSHKACIVPILLATEAPSIENVFTISDDGLAGLLCVNKKDLSLTIRRCHNIFHDAYKVDFLTWLQSAYKPTPTIIQAAQALYQGHQVEEISRSDAGAKNLSETAAAINAVIDRAKAKCEKAICFVTGVPGAGKTLAGLNVTTNRMRSADDEHAVFLSGNGPLVEVLQEALARDEHSRAELPIGIARRKSQAFIQNIHHFRDDSLKSNTAPIEKVVVFDEAQRAWDKHNTAKFMQQKRDQSGFDMSEPEFLIQVMDRHEDWCVIVALIGGGQEINTGEAGLPEWFSALRRSFSHWRVCYSDHISGEEYTQGEELSKHLEGLNSESNHSLHLGVSIRSFRAEKLSAFVGCLINNEQDCARELYREIKDVYPIALTRNLHSARVWLKNHARGSELYGLVASSGANRLKPEGINIKAKITPSEWFLNGEQDVRSCQYLEDVATEFDIQGLELDWVGVCWDADFRYESGAGNFSGWSFNAFKGTRWQCVNTSDRRRYLANSYRVLLTRARQGMVIYVPTGSYEDPTRPPIFYDKTFEMLKSCGIDLIV